MKIYVDKIESEPPHGLLVRELRLVFKTVPADWLNGLKEVRLSNSLEYYQPYAYFNRYDRYLTIYSRVGSKRQVLTAILSALSVETLGFNRGLRRRRSESEIHQIDRLIQPYVAMLLAALTPPPARTKLSPEAHVPIHFAPFPNDPIK